MKFAFAVKHNGVLYQPGTIVPIGEEPKKDIAVEDKTATELSNELKEKYDIDMPAQKGKKKLLEALEEAEKQAKEDEKEDPETPENPENPEGDETEGEGNEDETFLDKIINE